MNPSPRPPPQPQHTHTPFYHAVDDGTSLPCSPPLLSSPALLPCSPPQLSSPALPCSPPLLSPALPASPPLPSPLSPTLPSPPLLSCPLPCRCLPAPPPPRLPAIPLLLQGLLGVGFSLGRSKAEAPPQSEASMPHGMLTRASTLALLPSCASLSATPSTEARPAVPPPPVLRMSSSCSSVGMAQEGGATPPKLQRKPSCVSWNRTALVRQLESNIGRFHLITYPSHRPPACGPKHGFLKWQVWGCVAA